MPIERLVIVGNGMAHGRMSEHLVETAPDPINIRCKANAKHNLGTDAVGAVAHTDKCPHKTGPLSQGIVHDGCKTRRRPNWVVALDSSTAQDANEDQPQSFPIKMDGDAVLLGLYSPPTTQELATCHM
ncbi:MAG: hypothetical protein ABJO67_19575 [Pseudoruegeria sp.]